MSHRLHLTILALAAASLACSIFVGGPEIPESTITDPQSNLQAIQGMIEQAVVGGLADGRLHLVITQEQLTAYLASRLSSDENALIANPVVVLGNQEMVLYGLLHFWIFEANAAATARFTVDEAGLPQISISDSEVGPVPLPQFIRDSISAAIDEALTGYIGPVVSGFRLESIDISSGTMTLVGRLR